MMSCDPFERSTGEQLVLLVKVDRVEAVAPHVRKLVELRLLNHAVAA